MYLRPAPPGMFQNCSNVLTPPQKPAVSGGAGGKSFRTRSHRETSSFDPRVEQMELEFSCAARSPHWYGTGSRRATVGRRLGIPIHARVRPRCRELSHIGGHDDIEFALTWWGGLEGVPIAPLRPAAARGTLVEKLDYFDQPNERYQPFVIEPAAGATRAMMAFLIAAYDEDVVNDEKRTVLRLHPRLAPYKVAVLPLSKKEPLTSMGHDIAAVLREHYMVDYDETQAIGRRYRRQDEIGTPLCITVDFESVDDKSATIRDRDSTTQVRVPIETLVTSVRHGWFLSAQAGLTIRSSTDCDACVGAPQNHRELTCGDLNFRVRKRSSASCDTSMVGKADPEELDGRATAIPLLAVALRRPFRLGYHAYGQSTGMR